MRWPRLTCPQVNLKYFASMKGVRPEVSEPENPLGSVPRKVDQRIELLDRRQTPVAESAVLGGIELGGALLGLCPSQLAAAGQGAVDAPGCSARSGRCCCRKPSGRLCSACSWAVPPGRSRPGRRRLARLGDFEQLPPVVEDVLLPGIDDAVGQRAGAVLWTAPGLGRAWQPSPARVPEKRLRFWFVSLGCSFRFHRLDAIQIPLRQRVLSWRQSTRANLKRT